MTARPPTAGPDRDTGAWVNDANAALMTDLYELTMLRAYFEEGLEDQATFSLFVRRLPKTRSYLLACGLEDVLRYLERLSFDDEDLAWLGRDPRFPPPFLERLARLRFTGEVRAVAEGTPVFADEPILEVTAPLLEAQLVETFVMNQVHLQTLAASKAARVVAAARGHRVVDFGVRRMHGTDAGMKAARAFFVAGVAGTSNVLAGKVHGIPVIGTMAHSFVQAHEDELEAFRSFTGVFPETVLLVDTYDTLSGVDHVIRLARELGEAFAVQAVRLDSGDLADLARATRRRLDAAGLQRVGIFASGGLDEYAVASLLAAGAPIDGFGVGTAMGVSADAPSLDLAYKLTAYAGVGRLKLSPGKPILPGRKQVFRIEDEAGEAHHDVIAREDEAAPGRPLLEPVMREGRRLEAGRRTLDHARRHAAAALAALPPRLHALDADGPGYEVRVSEALQADARAAQARVARRENLPTEGR